MQLNDEIKQAAQELGSLLGENTCVSEYLRFKQLAGQDEQAASLEQRQDALYQKLIENQQNGEHLDQAELDQYYGLKRQVQEHPVLAAREGQLVAVKALFAETAKRMTNILGVDYSAFARRED